MGLKLVYVDFHCFTTFCLHEQVSELEANQAQCREEHIIQSFQASVFKSAQASVRPKPRKDKPKQGGQTMNSTG